jgi:hypothetical protein
MKPAIIVVVSIAGSLGAVAVANRVAMLRKLLGT